MPNIHLLSSPPQYLLLVKDAIMKIMFAFLLLIAIPVVLLIMLVTIVIPLFVQHFFTPKAVEDKVVFPYLTSWEAAA